MKKMNKTMLKMVPTAPTTHGNDGPNRKRPINRPIPNKRGQSVSPVHTRPRSASIQRKAGDRRCQSLSPTVDPGKLSVMLTEYPPISSSAPATIQLDKESKDDMRTQDQDKDAAIPQCVVQKMLRILATKKREFIKMRKAFLSQQKSMLAAYASLRELESRAGVTSENSLGEVRVLSVTGWPAHDLLMLLRDDLDVPLNSDISGLFGPQILQQIHAQLNPIPEEVLGMGAEIMARRIDLLNLIRGKHRLERSNVFSNLESKAKSNEFDNETEKLHRMVAGTVENLKAKVNYCMELIKIPWLDRETLIKKIERQQKDLMVLQSRLDDITKKDEDGKEIKRVEGKISNTQAICEELAKERAAREALKEVVSSAESMLRVARARISTLERQLKDMKSELDAAKKKHKDLEQLYRQRESTYDARSRKLLEVSKTGEITIEALSRQRDALELRVKELREQVETSEKIIESRQKEEKSRVETLQAKVAEQEKVNKIAEQRVMELEKKVMELEEALLALRERSVKLVDAERRRCLEYVPSKENEPTDRETEIWKELQVTRVALSRAEEELRSSRADKDAFLNSLSKIAQGEDLEGSKEKLAADLVDREKKISKLQHVIEELRENEKIMEQSMTQYENQMAALRLEIRRLRNYECYSKDVPYQELETELLDLHMQVETLSRERNSLVNAAASRALMLERHERSAELFARMIKARRDLAALLDGRTEPPPFDESMHTEVSRSLSSICATAAETWSALRAERARVLRLESAVLSQTVQLEREELVRTQLERRRALLERELLRTRFFAQEASSIENSSLVPNSSEKLKICWRT